MMVTEILNSSFHSQLVEIAPYNRLVVLKVLKINVKLTKLL